MSFSKNTLLRICLVRRSVELVGSYLFDVFSTVREDEDTIKEHAKHHKRRAALYVPYSRPLRSAHIITFKYINVSNVKKPSHESCEGKKIWHYV